jgi:hypothetical protein
VKSEFILLPFMIVGQESPSLALFEVARLFSPEGAAENSQGRKPLETRFRGGSPAGAAVMVKIPPYFRPSRALDLVLPDQLLTVAPRGLARNTQLQNSRFGFV